MSGVLLKKREDAIDRPMLVFLRRKGHGHYVVVRPVGHTGKLVQVIDNFGPPEVVDKATLLASPVWTGIALLRESRSNRTSLLADPHRLIEASKSFWPCKIGLVPW